MSIPAQSRCTSCGKPRQEGKGVHHWCGACTSRWYRHGCPEDGPPPPVSHAERCARSNAARVAGAQWRAAEYARLRKARYTPAQAALRLGLALATGRDYERRYRAASGGEIAPRRDAA